MKDTIAIIFMIIDFVGGFLLGMMIQDHKYQEYPTAIEVYRGNTTLEITYRDSIPVDSTVIYKYK